MLEETDKALDPLRGQVRRPENNGPASSGHSEASAPHMQLDTSALSDAWKTAVDFAGADFSIGLLAADVPTRRGSLFSSGCSKAELAQLDIEGLRSWFERHAWRARSCSRLGVQRLPCHLADVAQASKMTWIEDIGHIEACFIDVGPEGVFWLLLGRRTTSPALLDPDRRRFALACLTLSQCAVHHATVVRRERRLQILEGLLDELAPALILVNSRGRIFWTNAQAELLLAEKQVMIRTGGNLIGCPSATRTSLLRDKIAEAADRATINGDDRYVLLPRDDGGEDIVVLRSVHGRHGLEGNRAVLLIVPQHDTPRLAQDLILSFGLIRSEARFVAAVIETGAPALAARRLGLSQQTAKTYLKRIYAKLGVSNQLELAVLVTSLTPPLRSAGGLVASSI